MRIAPDTNVLVRALTRDDERQYLIAAEALESATVVVLTMPALCELAWVLSSRYHLRRPDIARAIGVLASGDNVIVEAGALAAGLAMLEMGGDFADAVIAHHGREAGAETFVSFDQVAVTLLTGSGEAATLLS